MAKQHDKSELRVSANDFRDEGDRAKQDARAEKVKPKNLCVCQQRRLTVRAGYHSYQLNTPFNDRSPVPLIELKGNWLHKAGFTQQSNVNVRVMQRCLVITIED